MKLPVWGVVVLWLLHVLPFAGRPALIGGDEPHYALMAHSIAVDRDLELENNYLEVEAGSAAAGRKMAGRVLDRHLVQRGERTVFSHPLGLPALVAPLLWLLHGIRPAAAPDLILGLVGLGVTFLALLEGLRLLTQYAPDRRRAMILGLMIYFSTPLWFYSRTFFTEPYVWSGLVLSLGLLDRKRIRWASLLLGAILLIKETSVLAIGPILAWAWWRWGSRTLLRLAVFPATAVLLYGLKNLWVYGDWWVTFQPFEIGSPWWRGFIGLLLDSRHGLLPFAPVALGAIAPWIAGAKAGWRPQDGANWLALAAFSGYFVVSALWVDWRGGSCFGPRLLVPVIPALAFPLLSWADRRRLRPEAWKVMAVLSVVGFAVQWSAVTSPFTAFWSASVVDLTWGRPLPFVTGLLLGSLALWRLSKSSGGGGMQPGVV